MIIETRDAEDARQVARRLLEAAGRDRAQVQTVWRGARVAFRVPDELGAAIGRAPDSSDAADGVGKTAGGVKPTDTAPAGAGTSAGDPVAGDPVAGGDPVKADDPVASDDPVDESPDEPADEQAADGQAAPKKRGRKRIE